MPSGNYQVQVDDEIVSGHNDKESAISAARAWQQREPGARVRVYTRGAPMRDSRGNPTGAYHRQVVEHRRQIGVRHTKRGYVNRYE